MSIRTEKYIECDANQCGRSKEHNGNNYIHLEVPSNFDARDDNRHISDIFGSTDKELDFCTMDCMLTYIQNELFELEGMFSHE